MRVLIRYHGTRRRKYQRKIEAFYREVEAAMKRRHQNETGAAERFY